MNGQIHMTTQRYKHCGQRYKKHIKEDINKIQTWKLL